MATDFTSIPIIDISPWVEKLDDANMDEDAGMCAVVTQLDQACRQAGFFYVKGHGIPDLLLKEVKDTARQFFYLHLEEKRKVILAAETEYRGYQEFEDNVTNGFPDMHEAIEISRAGRVQAAKYIKTLSLTSQPKQVTWTRQHEITKASRQRIIMKKKDKFLSNFLAENHTKAVFLQP